MTDPLDNEAYEQVAQSLVRHRFNVRAVARSGDTKYSEKHLYRLADNADIQLRIRDLLTESSKVLRIDVGVIKHECALVGLSDITDVLACASVEDIQALPPETRRAIKKVRRKRRRLADATIEETLEIEMHSKMEALRLLAAIEGLLGSDSAGEGELHQYFAGMNLILVQRKEK